MHNPVAATVRHILLGPVFVHCPGHAGDLGGQYWRCTVVNLHQCLLELVHAVSAA